MRGTVALGGRGTRRDRDHWKHGPDQTREDVLGHEHGHKVLDVVVQVEQKLGQRHGVILQPAGKLLGVLRLVVEHRTDLANQEQGNNVLLVTQFPRV